MNASNPTLDALRADFFQTESKTVFVPATGLVLTALTDQQGVVRKSGPTTLTQITPGYVYQNGALVWKGQTYAGLSSWSILAPNWTSHPPLQPIAPAQCLVGTDCPLLIGGDPWIATNGTRVLYSALAHTQYTTFAAIQQANATRSRSPARSPGRPPSASSTSRRGCPASSSTSPRSTCWATRRSSRSSRRR